MLPGFVMAVHEGVRGIRVARRCAQCLLSELRRLLIPPLVGPGKGDKAQPAAVIPGYPCLSLHQPVGEFALAASQQRDVEGMRRHRISGKLSEMVTQRAERSARSTTD